MVQKIDFDKFVIDELDFKLRNNQLEKTKNSSKIFPKFIKFYFQLPNYGSNSTSASPKSQQVFR